MYELKKLKVHEDMSDETTCFSAEVWLKKNQTWPDGVKVCTARNEGQGGPNNYDPDYSPAGRELFKTFAEYAKAQPHEFNFELIDQYVDTLMAQYETTRFLKKNCRNQTLFRIKGDAPDSWRTVKAPYAPKVKDFIQTKYGDKVEVIANEAINA